MYLQLEGEKNYDQFYEQTGILLTEEPLGNLPESLEEDATYIYENVFRKPAKLIPRIKKLIERYPNIPSLKNYLYIAYVKTGKIALADRLLEKTIEKHPKYIFAISNFINKITDEKELLAHAHLLGNPRSILSFHEQGEKIHISEYLSYQSTAIHFDCFTGDLKSAKDRLRDLMSLNIDKDQLHVMASKISTCQLTRSFKELEEKREAEINVEVVPKYQTDKSGEKPVLQNPVLFDLFYNNSVTDFSKEQIDQVMAIPTESLFPDLELILADAIHRKSYFEDIGYDYNTHEFLIHACYLLGALGATQSLESVLDLLRMDSDFDVFWFADFKESILFPTMYLLGKDQLNVLQNFVLEENNNSSSRGFISEVVSQVAMHHPERREEVLEWFRTVLEYHLEHPDNKGIIDSFFIASCISDLTNLRAKEFLPLIQKLYDKKWVSILFVGLFSEIEEEMHTPFEPYKINPYPENIYEFYSKEYEKRKVPYPSGRLEDHRAAVDNDPVEKLISEAGFGFSDREEKPKKEKRKETLVHHSNNNPLVRENPKIGRNDPCMCGSGKKYKHCCLRN